MATTTDAIFTGTGWVTLTSAATSGTVRYRVASGWCFVQCISAVFSVASGVTSVLVTAANGIPTAYRPSSTVYNGAFSGNAVGFVAVGTDGSVSVHASTAAMAGVSASLSYPVG